MIKVQEPQDKNTANNQCDMRRHTISMVQGCLRIKICGYKKMLIFYATGLTPFRPHHEMMLAIYCSQFSLGLCCVSICSNMASIIFDVRIISLYDNGKGELPAIEL